MKRGIVNEDLHIIDCIKIEGRKAYEQTLRAGIPATVLRGNTICRIYPDGRKEALGEVKRSRCKVARTYTLKKK